MWSNVVLNWLPEVTLLGFRVNSVWLGSLHSFHVGMVLSPIDDSVFCKLLLCKIDQRDIVFGVAAITVDGHIWEVLTPHAMIVTSLIHGKTHTGERNGLWRETGIS